MLCAQGPLGSRHLILQAHLGQHAHFPLSPPPPLNTRAGQQGWLVLFGLPGGEFEDWLANPTLSLPVQRRYRVCMGGVTILEPEGTCSVRLHSEWQVQATGLGLPGFCAL